MSRGARLIHQERHSRFASSSSTCLLFLHLSAFAYSRVEVHTVLMNIISAFKWQAWVGEMALFVKSVDNKHLLTVGTEEFYTSDSEGCSNSNPSSYFGTVGTDFIGDHDLPGIDFATTHAYPDSW